MGRHARAVVGWAHQKEHDDTPEDVKEHINRIYRSVGLSDREDLTRKFSIMVVGPLR